MEVNLNENEDFEENIDYCCDEQVVWTTNPLFGNTDDKTNNNNKDGISEDFIESNDKFCETNKSENSTRSSEFETESGYSETVSVFSELSSPDPSSVCTSDIEDERDLQEVTETMRRAALYVDAKNNDLDVNSPTGIGSSQIISSKGTIRGVKNRVRDNIMHFLSGTQNENPIRTAKRDSTSILQKDPDRGKVIIYTTSLGLVRSTQYECRYIKRIFHNLMVRLDERDLFVHPHFKEELQRRLGKETMTLPQVFINGKLIGGAKEVEKMIETGTMKEAIANVERVSHAQSCPACGGYRFISCSKCSGSGKSRRTRFTREINSLKCSACSNGMISCPECNS